MLSIKAIETRYKGYRFRSRLEARWAVFFDALGWTWRYEHEGYEIGWDERRKYLPDFHIRTSSGQSLYVEVKGDPDFFADGKFLDLFDFCGGPPGHGHSAPQTIWAPGPNGWSSNSKNCPLLILGDVPSINWGSVFVPVVAHYKGVVVRWCEMTPAGFIGTASERLFCMMNEGDVQPLCGESPPALKDFQVKVLPTPMAFKEVVNALSSARSARFEHGESGARRHA